MLKPSEKQFTKEIEHLGTFTFKYPTLKNEIEADNISARLLGENLNPSVHAANIAIMTGTLKMAIVEAPADFDIDSVYSYDELESVYNAFTSMVSSFRNKSKLGKPPGDKASGAG